MSTTPSFLLIVPCGKTSTHLDWKEQHTDCGFDLCLLNYSNEEFTDKNSKSAKFVFPCSGMKWKLISKLYLENPQLIDQYDYVMMMDDDIETSPSEIKKFFDVCHRYEFDLAQPGLGVGSNYTYPSTAKISNAIYHETTTVEIMTPCFSKRVLKQTIDDIHSCSVGLGWGLEGVWICKFLSRNGGSVFGGKIGVIDCVDFYHRRPVGGKESKIYERFGSPLIELHYHERKYGFSWGMDMFRTISVVSNKDEM